MPVTFHVMSARVQEVPSIDLDVQELASQAAVALESYRRAPWTRVGRSLQLTELRHAILLLQRVENQETGCIPTEREALR